MEKSDWQVEGGRHSLQRWASVAKFEAGAGNVVFDVWSRVVTSRWVDLGSGSEKGGLYSTSTRATEEEEFSGAAAEDMQGGTYIENTLTDVYS